MNINELVNTLKMWGTNDDTIGSEHCVDNCRDCELNTKVLIGKEFISICNIIYKVNKELNTDNVDYNKIAESPLNLL